MLGVRPRADMPLDDRDPSPIPPGERARGAGVLEVLVDLPDDVGVISVDRLLPLLVGIEELVPVGRLERGPLLGVAAGPVGEAVDPALEEVTLGIGLDVDRHVLVYGRSSSGGREVV